MQKTFFFILFILSWSALVGCRSSREVKASEQRTQSTEIGVEAHRLDSLWSLLAERYKIHVEFFNPNEVLPQQDILPENPFTGSPLQSTKATQQGAAPSSTMTANSQFPKKGVSPGVGSIGAVKSIDIEAERSLSEQSLSKADSTTVSKTATDEARQTEKASETRQDNGTVAIVSIVAAVAFLIFIIIRTYRKK